MTAPTPFTIERVAKIFDEKGYNYNTDDDGDIYAGFDENKFMLLATGQKREVFAVRSAWKATGPIESRATLMEFCNEWNRTKMWPKTYVTVNDEGIVGVQAEVNTDLEHGVTDAQLEQLLNCGIATALQFFQELTEQFAVAQADEPKE
ncbi:YbjN domain-containing protein [Corynebacterium sp. ES2775-CONJ]|uniref:YbjN domain-containing protein n=1 Tax=Corynebacterium sp. ES2775-CONJ TaxID=2974029 RepID=UPI0021677BF2|nr:YbjN domain-containing protein [Corynebacterium sp. ES2775-CONJ]MCS4490197.1 YbjN domain-containing protein [Corynebacterium sp. ES2775-CONJ]